MCGTECSSREGTAAICLRCSRIHAIGAEAWTHGSSNTGVTGNAFASVGTDVTDIANVTDIADSTEGTGRTESTKGSTDIAYVSDT
jgi:hypothetical protein